MTDWPKHPDGRPMKMGEMTAEQRREQTTKAVNRLQAWFDKPEVKAGLAAALDADPNKPQ